jgi:single-strand DNA-binding protein
MTNIVVIVGNVGQDPTRRVTQGGTTITSLSVATSRRWKNSAGESQEETEWHRVTCFNGLGDNVAKYTAKGSKVSVQGRIHYTRWTDNDGVERYGCEIYADEVNFLTKAPAASDEEPAKPATKAPGKAKGKTTEPDLVDDDVPF